MNERIRELADKAGIPLSSFQFSGIPTKYEVAESDLEKFAELIVRECIEICRSEDWEDQQGWGKFYAHQIKKQFEAK